MICSFLELFIDYLGQNISFQEIVPLFFQVDVLFVNNREVLCLAFFSCSFLKHYPNKGHSPLRAIVY